MKKIAVCIPSYNESDNISNTLIKVDKELAKYISRGYDTIIVNVDNDSPDHTSEVFLNTVTKCPKKSFINKEKGKGINLLTFFKYCKDNNVDYAVTIDADVKSMKSNWITKFLNPIMNDNYDYVTPIYKRSRFEGSTTNHFAFPIVYGITGKPIRQPIAGDFAFNKKFIDLVSKYPVSEYTKKYGIDIYMTLIAAYNNLNIFQIELEKKIHNPSYNKMENMFFEVLNSYIHIYRYLKSHNELVKQKDEPINISTNIINSRKFNHKQRAKEMYLEYYNKLNDKNNIEEQWLNKLKRLIINIDEIDENEINEIFYLFMVRATKFWLESERMSALKCDERIINQAKSLRKMIKEERK